MNNLITIFMNYKIERLVEYAIFLYKEDTPFLRNVFHEYFSVYVDNYYYGIFHTIDDTKYTKENLEKEFTGIMQEMLYDYLEYELVESNEEYQKHVNLIKELREISLEVIKIDSLEISKKEEVTPIVKKWIEENEYYKNQIEESRISKFTKLVRETVQNTSKLLHLEDHYFTLKQQSFEDIADVKYALLNFNINILQNYRKTMVSRVFQKDQLERQKVECLIQKISLTILKNILEKKEVPTLIMELKDIFIKRGRIEDDIYNLLDNPLFRQYVVLGVSYNIYTNQTDAFGDDFSFACIQDFVHINDVYQKIDTIAKEGVFSYLVVSDYKYKDRDYFTKYENNAMKILLFEED